MSHNIEVPNHLGLILDGNRRWAQAQGLPLVEGHRQGYENLKTTTRAAFEAGVKYVSAYVFSTENWERAKEEVDYLMNLSLKIATKDVKSLIKENIKIVVLGIEEKVPKKLIDAWRTVETDSKNNTGGVLALCFNYGGLREITDAVRAIVRSGVKEEDIDERMFMENLYHPELPAVDLMIRTSGEMRISNFMLPRMAYAELYFSKKHWPDFGTEDLNDSLEWFSRRTRRRGK